MYSASLEIWQQKLQEHENIEYSPADWIEEKYPKFILSSEEEAFNWLKEKETQWGGRKQEWLQDLIVQ